MEMQIVYVCVDKARPGRISDCPANARLCRDPTYEALMTDQCPRTCNKCGVTTARLPFSGNFGNGTCVDLALPGKLSDCPRYASLCTNNAYRALMSRQCPRTCGLCPATVAPVIGRK
ncbi:unnamed protein product [Toxocara canis]|uniref:ShTK domain protein n=1 Tax=Toxocara canis TaxID=6265 RepID=A0A183VH95_TOXCA|nr:unnamed protein product [Toxocara canis]